MNEYDLSDKKVRDGIKAEVFCALAEDDSDDSGEAPSVEQLRSELKIIVGRLVHKQGHAAVAQFLDELAEPLHERTESPTDQISRR